MGLLGKLFGSESKGDAPLRAYGKLPFYAEYRRLEISPGAPTAFTQWLDAGRLAWANSATKSQTGAVRTVRMLVRIPASKEVAVASLWDSRDSLGRVFPFCFFIVCTPESLGANVIEQWASAWSIAASFDGLYAELRALSGGGDFYKSFGKRALPTRPVDLAERAGGMAMAAREIDAQAWLNAWVAKPAGDQSGWFSGAAAKSGWLRKHPDSMGDAALSFPLAAGSSVAAQAAMWIDWASPALAKLGKPPTIIVPAQDGGSSEVHMIVRDVVPDDFQLLTSDDTKYQYVERISAAAEPASVPAGSLLDWLNSPAHA